MSRRGTGITRRRWIEAGQVLLRSHGIDGVKIGALTQGLGVSSGSFYHHFENVEDYYRALTDYYAKEQWAQILEEAQADKYEVPVERLRAIGRVSAKTQFAKLAYAMRAWANSSVEAARAVRAFDKVGFAYLEKQLREMGFSRADAKVRAFLLIAAGSVEFDTRLTGLPESTLREVGLEVLTRE